MKRRSIGLVWGAICWALLGIYPTEGAATEYVVHSFGTGTDGDFPFAGLIHQHGKLYGTTNWGGVNCYCGDGTVFEIDLSTLKETVLHSFGSGKDGVGPLAGLVDVHGILYGTTQFGGTVGPYGEGTVFSIDPVSGSESVVYSFGTGTDDGTYPTTALIYAKGRLYGTTVGGGQADGGYGTVFRLNPRTGAEKVLHAFTDEQGDGGMPQAGLIEVNGTLYGTTWEGSAGDGTVFAVDPDSGKETVLYSFPDRSAPNAGLLNVGHMLYGTTYYGGAYGFGVVFSLDMTTLKEKVLHSFGGGNDGRYPTASLTYIRGKLYGTTDTGGTGSGCDSIGCGTVFAVDVEGGAENVLYSFCTRLSCTDGSEPQGNIILVGSTLYGTTIHGGSDDSCYQGCGVVFSLRNY